MSRNQPNSNGLRYALVQDGERPLRPFVGKVQQSSFPGLPTSHEPRVDMPVFHGDQFPSSYSTTDRPGPLTTPIARFVPPNEDDLPTTLFAPESNIFHPNPRYVRRTNWREFLIYTDGACPNNGQPDAQAGWAFVFHPSAPLANVKKRLELRGVDGELYPQTSNRAELRAVLGALEFRAWYGEGAIRLVIATDSEYVVLGATERVEKWRQSGWKTAARQPVKNRDLWEKLMARIEELGRSGTQTQFWLIPRTLNKAADKLAKEAAAQTEVGDEYAQIHGVMV